MERKTRNEENGDGERMVANVNQSIEIIEGSSTGKEIAGVVTNVNEYPETNTGSSAGENDV